jgi:hypothetical protein
MFLWSGGLGGLQEVIVKVYPSGREVYVVVDADAHQAEVGEE